MPLDQMHSENKPSHPELLAWLARDAETHNYDLKRLVRGLVMSRAYRRTSRWEQPGDRPSESTSPWPPLRPDANAVLAVVGDGDDQSPRSGTKARKAPTSGRIAAAILKTTPRFRPANRNSRRQFPNRRRRSPAIQQQSADRERISARRGRPARRRAQRHQRPTAIDSDGISGCTIARTRSRRRLSRLRSISPPGKIARSRRYSSSCGR